jgi:hypothetical protein
MTSHLNTLLLAGMFASVLLPALAATDLPPPPPGMAGASGPHAMAGWFLHDFDYDHDGKVARAEFDRGQAERFKRIDKNGDGVVTEAELEAMPRPSHLAGGPDAPLPPPPPGL